MVVKLREKYDFPVIFLSAKSEEVDKIMGLNMGADDYVTKPFTPMELLARVNSQLRRYRRFMEKLGDKEENSRIHTIGGLEINEDNVEVTVDGEPVKMTPIEYKILLLLMKNPGRVFSAEEIYERVWNERAINTDTIMVHVRNIREKIEVNPREPKYLKVVWGVDTKLKSRRKLGIFLIIVTILSAAYVMLYNYDMIYEKAVEEAQKTYTTSLSDREYLESFLEFSYILYNQEISSKTGEARCHRMRSMMWQMCGWRIMKHYILIWITGSRMDRERFWDEVRRIPEMV